MFDRSNEKAQPGPVDKIDYSPPSILEPISTPGLAIFPQYVAHEPTTLILRSKWFSKDLSILFEDGRPFIHASHHSDHYVLTEVASNTLLCVLHSNLDGEDNPYYARFSQDPNSPRIFETNTVKRTFHSDETDMQFKNALNGGQWTTLEFKDQGRFGFGGTITFDRVPVAVIMKKKWKVSHEYRMEVTVGMDMFIVAALAVVLQDQVPATSGRGEGGGGEGE